MTSDKKGETLIIDIHYKKLLEGLIDRKLVPFKWQEQIRVIHEEIEKLRPEILEKNPKFEHFFSENEITFYDCKEIMDFFDQSEEGKSKNFFGQYSSPLLKSWYGILKAYEKNNVFAGEAARHLIQNTSYEIPALKTSVQQSEKSVADNNRKIADHNKSIAEERRKLVASCRELGIDVDYDFRRQLEGLVEILPSLFAPISISLCESILVEAVDYHQSFQDYLHSDCVSDISKKPEFPNLKKIFTAKEADASINNTPVQVPVIPEMEEAVEIDWNITTCEGSGEVDWDISSQPIVENADEISWDIDTVTDSNAEKNEVVEIDWDIKEVGAVETVGPSVERVDDVKEVDDPSKIDLLLQSEFRAQLIIELMELQAFFQQRIKELLDVDGIAFANQFQGTSAILSQQSSDKLNEYLKAVDNCVNILSEKRLQQILLIQHSPRYLDRLILKLDQKLSHMDKFKRKIQILQDRNMELIDTVSRNRPKIEDLISTTKKLKTQLEQSLPKLFKGHSVNIMGEINNL